MPRFFFDTTDGFDHLDEEGHEMPDAQIAGMHALRVLREMAFHEDVSGSGLELTCTVRDDAGKVVYRASLKLEGRSSIE